METRVSPCRIRCQTPSPLGGDAAELAGLNDIVEGAPLVIAANGGEVIRPHPKFRVIATGNSAGTGDTSGLYQGVLRQNLAFLDRFRVIQVDYPDDATEQGLLRTLVPKLPEAIGEILALRYDNDGRLDLSDLDSVITERARVVTFVHQSNILGTINDPAPLVARAREVGAMVLLDACQSVPHLPMSLPETGADFVAWSGHKMLGPTGIGFLWARPGLLATMPPFITGGSMIGTPASEIFSPR